MKNLQNDQKERILEEILTYLRNFELDSLQDFILGLSFQDFSMMNFEEIERLDDTNLADWRDSIQ